MSSGKVPVVEKAVTDVVGSGTAAVGLLALTESLLNPGFLNGSLTPVKGTFLSLTVIGFGVVLTTHGATKALKQLRKTMDDIRDTG